MARDTHDPRLGRRSCAALRSADLPRVVETRSDPDTQHWLQGSRESAPHTLESHARVRGRAAGRRRPPGRAAALGGGRPASPTAYLGQISLFGVQHRREAELGYWTHPDARGRGVTTEACRLRGAALLRARRGRRPGAAPADRGRRRRQPRLAARPRARGLPAHRPSPARSTLLRDGTWADSVTYDQLAPERADRVSRAVQRRAAVQRRGGEQHQQAQEARGRPRPSWWRCSRSPAATTTPPSQAPRALAMLSEAWFIAAPMVWASPATCISRIWRFTTSTELHGAEHEDGEQAGQEPLGGDRERHQGQAHQHRAEQHRAEHRPVGEATCRAAYRRPCRCRTPAGRAAPTTRAARRRR